LSSHAACARDSCEDKRRNGVPDLHVVSPFRYGSKKLSAETALLSLPVRYTGSAPSKAQSRKKLLR
jgi:hypothetical protein